MLERHVYCGGLRPKRRRANDILLNVDAATGSSDLINLRLDQLRRRLADDLPAELTDLIEIAAYVYCADQFASRGSNLMRGMGEDWRRRLHFRVPVRQLGIWTNQEVYRALTQTLSFLTEDEFSFEFVKADEPRALQTYLGFGHDEAQTVSPDAVVLFSGGLDSLSGAVESLLQEKRRVVLVSHQSSNFIASRQNDLVAALRERSPPRSLFHAPVRVDSGSRDAVEFTQRTRSFMFAALALIVARMFAQRDIRFYENGPVSFNLPISEHVIGTRASRTTHPQFLHRCGELFSLLVAETVHLNNPYVLSTKSDVLKGLVRNDCSDLLGRAFSCAHIRGATKTGKHCGVCSQCIDRRFGVLAAGMGDQETLEGYEVDLLRGEHQPGPARTMIESYVFRAQQFSSMSRQAFMVRFGQIFRALPYLDGTAEQNVSRIWDLHRRHGAEVVSVIDSEFKTGMTVATAMTLASNSLLGLVAHPIAEQPAYVDPTEVVANSDEGRDVQAAPILLAIDAPKRKVVFDRGVATGYGYAVVEKLAEHAANTANEAQVPFVQANKLAEQLGIDGQMLRQHVSRFRREIKRQFLERLDRHLSDDAVIENIEWQGYRLNSNVVQVPLRRVQFSRGVSQVAGPGVTSPPENH